MVIFALLIFCLAGWACAGQSPSSNSSGDRATNATFFALEYGYPIYKWATFVEGFFNSENGINVLIPDNGTASPQAAIVGPNVDVIYSNALFDISAHDLIVTIPEIDASRYWSFAFYSAIGDNFGIIGSIHGSLSGTKYTLHWNPERKDWPSTGVGKIVDSPAAYGLILVRVLVKNNGTDLAHVQQLINTCKLSKGPPHPSNGVAPFSFDVYRNLSASNFAYSVLEATALTQKAVPPFNVPDPESVVEELRAAGISDGRYLHPHSVNLTSVGNEATAAAENYSMSAFKDLNNGWITYKIQGLWGSNYLARSYTFIQALEVLLPTEALYPTHLPARINVSSTQSYLYTFSSRPPLGITGYWSLTLYNLTDGLVSNPENIYSVGDRSNLTYPDGSLVYGSGDNQNDEMFQILVQSQGVPPPSNWTQNWIPAPQDNGIFSVILRLYSPTLALTNGSWLYPELTTIDPITA